MDRRSARKLLTAFIALSVFGGSASPYAAATRAPEPWRALVYKHEPDALRVRTDLERHRLWVLTVDQVYVYDTRKLALIRRIALPNWSVAEPGFMCPPDMAIDRNGTAFVSNNVQPWLVQIGPAEFKPIEHELKLVSPKQWEVGFGALTFAADGTLFAVSALAGSRFRIDLDSRTATEIGPVANEACEGR